MYDIGRRTTGDFIDREEHIGTSDSDPDDDGNSSPTMGMGTNPFMDNSEFDEEDGDFDEEDIEFEDIDDMSDWGMYLVVIVYIDCANECVLYGYLMCIS